MRTPAELLAGLGRWALTLHRGKRAMYRYAQSTRENMFRSADELLFRQLAALTRLVDYAYNNSRFYRQRYHQVGFRPGDIKNFSDMARLPELTKSDLIDNMDAILCLPRSEMCTAQTSGTSGQQLAFFRSRRCQTHRRGIDLAWARYFGWRDGQWHGWLWGATPDVLMPFGWKARLVRHWAERQYFMDVSRLSNENYQAFVDQTRRYQPPLVSAYPSLAHDLAQRIEAGEVSGVRVPVLSTTAEPLHDFQRNKIKAVLADEVYERYGAREYGIVAVECPVHQGQHVFTDSVYLETVETDSASGLRRLLVTDLLNLGMPLIRYHSGDYAELDPSACSCGLSSPRLRNIQGREVSTIWRPDGSGISGIKVTHLVEQTDINARVQIEQVALNRIVIRVEASPGSFEPGLNKLVQRFSETLGPGLRYEKQYVTRIERAPSGKYQYVISRVRRPQPS
ncbi:MAG: hypothetical protein OEW00_07145 [candidate division Zixibacteria bacterium]|nr:hypothetical protein [candidate division Zixibacteria bacterium]